MPSLSSYNNTPPVTQSEESISKKAGFAGLKYLRTRALVTYSFSLLNTYQQASVQFYTRSFFINAVIGLAILAKSRINRLQKLQNPRNNNTCLIFVGIFQLTIADIFSGSIRRLSALIITPRNLVSWTINSDFLTSTWRPTDSSLFRTVLTYSLYSFLVLLNTRILSRQTEQNFPKKLNRTSFIYLCYIPGPPVKPKGSTLYI